MDSDASESYEHLYDEKDAAKHDKLVHKVLSLNRPQNLKKPSRTEPTLQISEFNLTKATSGKQDSVAIDDLTKSLNKKKKRAKIGEHVRRLKKNAQTLPKPLEKPQATRIRRAFAYEKTRLELDRWESTVTANRVSTHLTFPLGNDFKVEQKESEKFTSMWRAKSKLEKELEKHDPKVEEFHISLEQEKFPLTMKEMLMRRKEMAKLKAFQRNKEAKAHRDNKIKSKKYHRIKKREMIKQKLKELEVLQKTDPEAALKKLDEIEKSRAEERFSLRHKSTGKWARNQQIRAKYDKETRQTLAEQLKLSRDLTQKNKPAESSSDEEDEVENVKTVVDEDNPWVSGVKPGKEVTDFISDYRKYWTEQNKKSQSTETEEKENEPETTEKEPETTQKKPKKNVAKSDNKKEPTKLSKKKSPKKEKVAKASDGKKTKKIKKKPQKVESTENPIDKPTPRPEAIIVTDPEPDKIPSSSYPKPQTVMLSTAIPDMVTNEEIEEGQRALISEAFEDDDIVTDFGRDKETEIDKGKPKDVNLALPGWGSWGGSKSTVSRRKQRRFTLKAPKKVRRRDENKEFLIINEGAQSKVKDHMVSEVPFPFRTVKDFEASMRAPISNTFVPETAYRKLIRPAVSTKMGTIIEPIDRDILVNKAS